MLNRPKILVIKSDKSELKKVERFLYDVFKEFNLTRINFNKTLLCVSEAVINSIEHGNQFDRKKLVTIQLECNSNELNIKINDEGDGFDCQKVKDPTNKENLKCECGRGIHIIKSLSDSFQYNEKGNSVLLKLNVSE